MRAHRQIAVAGIEIMRCAGQQAPGQKLVHDLGLIALAIGFSPFPGDACNTA